MSVQKSFVFFPSIFLIIYNLGHYLTTFHFIFIENFAFLLDWSKISFSKELINYCTIILSYHYKSIIFMEYILLQLYRLNSNLFHIIKHNYTVQQKSNKNESWNIQFFYVVTMIFVYYKIFMIFIFL